jgi:transposase-like protein
VLDESTLRRMYLDEGQTIRQIASALEISSAQVYCALVQWHIPRRARGPRHETPVVTDTTRTVLRSMVAVLGMEQTAQRLKTTPQVIHAALGTRPLPRGSKPRVDDVVVRQAYESQMTQSEPSATARVAALAAQFGCSTRTIWRSLQRTRVRASGAIHAAG